DLTVIGGSVDVYGNVTGDLTVLGGSAKVHKDGHVHGDATAVGGTLDVEEGSTVDGDVGVIGGVLNRAPGATIHGEVVGGHGKKDIHVKLGDDDEHEPGEAPGFSMHRTMGKVGGALTRSAILFVFGAMLLALATDRMERLRLEIAARPMRSLALGVVGGLAAALSLVVLCITIIGIPIAVVASLVYVFAGYAGFCAALATFGQAIFGHRTKNPYVQLALACAVFLLVSSIPFVGGWFTAACALVGLGAVVATRGAGIWTGKRSITA
ncbi:MAG TPA: polymer-forming cytoskeletal protein, partial [Polyangiaceae bacterium]